MILLRIQSNRWQPSHNRTALHRPAPHHPAKWAFLHGRRIAQRSQTTAPAQDWIGADRSLRKAPGLVAAVVLTPALGIGVNATPFNLLKLTLPAAPTAAAPDRLMRIEPVAAMALSANHFPLPGARAWMRRTFPAARFCGPCATRGQAWLFALVLPTPRVASP